jgi:hypothetical protein
MGALRHDEETIELALTTLALAGDNLTRAVQMLRSHGVRVSRHALTNWRDSNAPRYAHIREVRARDIERSVVHKARALAEQYSDLEFDLIAIVRAQMNAGMLKDPSTTVRNVAVSKGIAIDKMLVVDGRPNTITETRSADDVLRHLTAMGYVDVAESIDSARLPASS